ncbi:MAG TPA: thioesterase domain-containing protein [Ktedonobacteraceae bacterium]|nr:thioesterase domain-containing protein [Ktedonobacteraceae bacterium]
MSFSISTRECWFMQSRQKPHARLRLFCFPYAGGGASLFRRWSEHLPDEVDVCPVQLPGRENRRKEAPFTQIQPLIETLVDVFVPYMDMPFAFFGYSLGALIGFELARQLRSQKRAGLLHLFVAGRKAPQILRREAPMSVLSDEAFIEVLRTFQGTPEEVLRNTELMRLFLPLLRADFAIYESYTYTAEAPLECAISAFGGIDDCKVAMSDLLAWKDQTIDAFTLRMFPGDHFFLSGNETALLQLVSRELNALLCF